jgi:tripartite-type tricarboxylate transporter receptor subunit TctC
MAAEATRPRVFDFGCRIAAAVRKRKPMSYLVRIGFASLLALSPLVVAAQTYPNRPIKLVVSFPPGGAADIVARLVGQPLSTRLGQPVVIDNKPGANGNIAGEMVARAPPDGYTLLMGPSALFVINPHLYAKMPFDPLKEFVPVATVQSNSLTLTANPSLAVKDFRNFVALAKRTTPPLFYASIGNGSEHHLAMELLKLRAGIDLVHVPYRGGGPAALAVMAGDVAAMFGGGSVAPMVQSGQLRGLAVSGPRRSALLPDLPAIAEFYPGYEVTIWQGIFAPVGTPAPIVERLRGEVNAVLAQGEYAAKLAAAGAGEPYLTTPEELSARIHSEHEKYGKAIKAIGAKVN